MTTYSALLATARKRVHSPYLGPTPGELAAKVVLENLSTRLKFFILKAPKNILSDKQGYWHGICIGADLCFQSFGAYYAGAKAGCSKCGL